MSVEIKPYDPPSAPDGMATRSTTRRIIWHCTADPEGRDNGPDDVWHTHVEINGWSHIGYHFLITLDGTIWACRPEDKVGAHTSGENSDSIGISYVGGMNEAYTQAKDTRTDAQREAMYDLTQHLLEKYGLGWGDVYGHNQFAAKACPSFDVSRDIEEWDDFQDGGDPEPDMPDLGALGLVVADLAARVRALEKWRRS